MTDFSKIKAITFDIDGVMTDGGLLCLDDGNFLRIFDAKDSFGLRMAQMAGIKLAVITGGTSPSLTQRFIKCGVEKENIYLRGFGSFIVKHRAKKTARNISKNTTLVIDAHDYPAFKPAKSFIEKMK